MKSHTRLVLTIAMLVVTSACSALASGYSSPFVTYSDVISDIRSARHVTLSAYTLDPRGAVLGALASAAHRNAHVHLVLTGEGFQYAIDQNCEILRRLTRSNSCTAGTTTTSGTMQVSITAYPLHMKALVTDESIVVTDTNFAKGSRHTPAGTFIELPQTMRETLLRAILGAPGYIGPFTTQKALSLRVEAAAIAGGSGPVSVETEDFTAHNPVYDALLAIAPTRHVIVVVNDRDAETTPGFQEAASALVRAGATIYLSSADEKIAVTGHTCWVGSTNVSEGLDDQVDWGLRIDDAQSCAYLASRILRNSGLTAP